METQKRKREEEDSTQEPNKKPASPTTIKAASRIKRRSIKDRSHLNVVDIKPFAETEIANNKVVDAKSSFASIDVKPWLFMRLAKIEIKRPTAIQKACIPEILAGKDVIGGSKTGSGKTVAFAVPMLQILNENSCGIFGLVLTPTRELAQQIYEQFFGINQGAPLKIALITGGSPISQQAIELSKRPHIVIATPGRLADHIRTSGPDVIAGFRKLKILVLDEADRLLASEARMMPDIETCLDALPPKEMRQTCMFTATLTDEIRQIKNQPRVKGRPPISVCEVDLGDPMAVPASLQLSYTLVNDTQREAYLHVLLSTPQNKAETSIVVFTNHVKTTNMLERMLRGLEHRVTSLHSELSQVERSTNLTRFRAHTVQILVATDVASRGLDIPEVGLVVNYDVPGNPDDYIHRVGRTGRAGRSGQAVTMVGQRDPKRVLAIEERIGRKMTEYAEEGVSIESRVAGDALKAVSEKKIEVLIGMEEGRDVKGNRTTGRIRRLDTK